jgi:hypothetical protein
MARAPINHTIAEGVLYAAHPHHRDNSRRNEKSQWTITETEEVASFTSAYGGGWIDAEQGWGLHRPNAAVAALGTATDGETTLYVAKFVSKNATPWHGYPADHQRRIDDVPSERLLKEWLDQGLVSNAAVRKLVKQQPCSL